MSDVDNYTHGAKLAAIVVCLSVIFFLTMLDVSILPAVVPYITTDFGSLSDVGWYGSSFQIATAAFQPLAGKMCTLFNIKACYLSSLLVFLFGSALCGASQSSGMLICGRAVAGAGAAGLTSGGYAIVNSVVEHRRRAGVLGLATIIGNLGAATGPLIGGAIVEYTTWRWCFYINLPVGALVLCTATCIYIPDRLPKANWLLVARRLHRELDVIGFALFCVLVVQLFLAVHFGERNESWNSSLSIGLFCGAGLALILFCWWMFSKGDTAMIPLAMLKGRLLWSSCCVIFFLSGTVATTSYYLPLYFQGARGKTALESGLLYLPTILSQCTFPLIAGILVQRVGYYLPFLLAGGALNSIGLGLLALIGPNTSIPKLIGFQILGGVGRGISLSMPIIALQTLLPAPDIPMSTSIFAFSQNLGGSILLVAAQTSFVSSLRNLLRRDIPGLDPNAVMTAGALNMADIIPSEYLPVFLLDFSRSAATTFYMAAGCGVLSLVFACFMGWKDIRVKGTVNENESHPCVSSVDSSVRC